MDLAKMSEEDLDTLVHDAQAEQERRRNLLLIPEDVKSLARTYVAGGGDIETLLQAVSDNP